MLGHVLLVVPALASAYLPEPPPMQGWAWALSRTPLHLLWAGGEAVSVFFVLSGYVLWLQVSHADWRRWVAYYPQRLIRLYVPVFAAVVFACALVVLVPRRGDPTFSGVINGQAVPLALTDVLHSLTLLAGTNQLNPPLWSLRAEVLFSLLLPLYGLALRQRWLPWWVSFAVLVATVEAGKIVGSFSLTYLPVFGLGVLMAHHRARIQLVAQDFGARAWTLIGLTAFCLLNAAWTPWTIGSPLIVTLDVPGAALLVLFFIHCPAAVRVGTSWVAQQLGRISFSLYLLHEPVIVATALALHTNNVFHVGVIAVPAALAASVLFFLAVEAPTVVASRSVGKFVQRRLRADQTSRGQVSWSELVADGVADASHRSRHLGDPSTPEGNTPLLG